MVVAVVTEPKGAVDEGAVEASVLLLHVRRW